MGNGYCRLQARCRRAGVAAGLGLLLTLGAGAAPTPPTEADAVVAVVTDLSGPGQLRRGAVQRPLAVLAPLQALDQLRLPAGATAELAFTAGTGSVVRVAGPGRFQVGSADIRPRDPGARVERRDLAAAWRGMRIRPGMVGRASIALRGLPATQVSLRAPLGGQDADDLRRLQWDQPYGHHAGAWDYTVRVIDDQGALLFASESRERSVALPAGLAFERERDYLWTVQARSEDRRHAYGAAEFHRIAADAERDVQRILASVVQLRRDADQPESSAEEVLLALALDQAGLHGAAQRQWRALAALRPSLAALPLRAP
jgi:hypothetical protein